MNRVGAVVRLLMLAACLVPFTSPRQASAALALPPPPAAPFPAPAGPVEHEQHPESDDAEETEREEQAGGKQAARAAHPLSGRPSAPSAGLAFPTRSPTISAPADPSRVAADPFHNGLGSPYRC